MHYNEEHHIVPTQIKKSLKQSVLRSEIDASGDTGKASAEKAIAYTAPEEERMTAADPIIQRMTREQIEKCIAATTKMMKEAAKRMDFMQAAQYRDEIARMQQELELKG